MGTQLDSEWGRDEEQCPLAARPLTPNVRPRVRGAESCKRASMVCPSVHKDVGTKVPVEKRPRMAAGLLTVSK